MEIIDNINIDELDKINLKEIRMCTFDLDALIETYNLALEDYKNNKITNFDCKSILFIISQFIRLKNDNEALIKFVKGTDLKDSMTQFLIEQSNTNKDLKIEKLSTYRDIDGLDSQLDIKCANMNFEQFYNKINELVDEVNKLKEVQ